MLRVVRENKLDARYKPAARKVTAMICAIPVFIVMSWILYKRVVLGEEQRIVIHKGEGEVEDAGVTLVGVEGREGEEMTKGAETILDG